MEINTVVKMTLEEFFDQITNTSIVNANGMLMDMLSVGTPVLSACAKRYGDINSVLWLKELHDKLVEFGARVVQSPDLEGDLKRFKIGPFSDDYVKFYWHIGEKVNPDRKVHETKGELYWCPATWDFRVVFPDACLVDTAYKHLDAVRAVRQFVLYAFEKTYEERCNRLNNGDLTMSQLFSSYGVEAGAEWIIGTVESDHYFEIKDLKRVSLWSEAIDSFKKKAMESRLEEVKQQACGDSAIK